MKLPIVLICSLPEIRHDMKTYIVYVNGNYSGMLKAVSHNAAEKKAYALHHTVPKLNVSVEYTEV
jgi:hypothetical protein